MASLEGLPRIRLFVLKDDVAFSCVSCLNVSYHIVQDRSFWNDFVGAYKNDEIDSTIAFSRKVYNWLLLYDGKGDISPSHLSAIYNFAFPLLALAVFNCEVERVAVNISTPVDRIVYTFGLKWKDRGYNEECKRQIYHYN